jgi:N-acetylglucosaminyl-diphospho-decaprenol L-rhamnosyltransferase
VKNNAQNPVHIVVVMVSYNSIDDLEAAWPALQKGLKNLVADIYVVDNNSQDGTQEFLSALQKNDPSLHLLFNSRNLGYSAAVNQGLTMAVKADYVLLLNPDVLILPDTVAILLQTMEKDQDIGVIAPQMRFLNGEIQPSCRRFPRQSDVFLQLLPGELVRFLPRLYHDWKMVDFDHDTSRYVDQPQGAFLLMRHQILAQVGLLDERFFMFFSDVDFCFRTVQSGWKIRFCAETFVFHKQGSSVNKYKQAMVVSSHRSFVDFFVKHATLQRQKFGIILVTVWMLVLLLPRLLLAQWDS